MNIKNLKIFLNLVESQSFSRTAKKNNITQSAVSQQLKSLENHFGIQIVDRGQKKFSLTPLGAKLHEGLQSMQNLYDKIKQDLDDSADTIKGAVRISTVYSIGLYELPGFIQSFLRKYPEVNFKINYRVFHDVYDDVAKGNADLGLVALPEQSNNVHFTQIGVDRMVIACSANHPIAQRESFTLADLKSDQLIFFDQDMPTRRSIESLLKEANVNIKPFATFENIEAVKRAIEAEIGVAIIPIGAAEAEINDGRIKIFPIESKHVYRPYGAITKKGRVHSLTVKTFLDHLHAQDKKF